MSHHRLNLLLHFAHGLIVFSNFNLDFLRLLHHFRGLALLVLILVFQNRELAVEAVHDLGLALQLGLVVALQRLNADLERFLAHLELVDLGLEVLEVSLVQAVRLNLLPVSLNYSISYSRADLLQFVGPLVLVLNPPVLLVLPLLPHLAMLLVGPVLRLGLLLVVLLGRLRSDGRPSPEVLAPRGRLVTGPS